MQISLKIYPAFSLLQMEGDENLILHLSFPGCLLLNFGYLGCWPGDSRMFYEPIEPPSEPWGEEDMALVVSVN